MCRQNAFSNAFCYFITSCQHCQTFSGACARIFNIFFINLSFTDETSAPHAKTEQSHRLNLIKIISIFHPCFAHRNPENQPGTSPRKPQPQAHKQSDRAAEANLLQNRQTAQSPYHCPPTLSCKCAK